VRVILKAALLRAGSSQRRAALCCGIPENRFSEIVCGWTEPRPEERARIAAFLNISTTDDLFDVEDVGRTSTAAEARSARR
jgi:hypothetical protein